MGDSDAALKRRVAAMEAALGALAAELATAQGRTTALEGGSDSALAAMAAAVTAQASVTQAQADATRAAAEASAKPKVPGVAAVPPVRAAYNLALALADRPDASSDTAVRDTWHAAWARRALQHRPAWHGEPVAILGGAAGGVEAEHAAGAASAVAAALGAAACNAPGARGTDPAPALDTTTASGLALGARPKAGSLRPAAAAALGAHMWQWLGAGARPLAPSRWHVRATEAVALACGHAEVRQALQALAAGGGFAGPGTGSGSPPAHCAPGGSIAGAGAGVAGGGCGI
eukprot:g4082.t1